MSQTKCKLYLFLQAVRGNWRNALFIECRECPFENREACRGFLLAADAEGMPILMEVKSFMQITGQNVEKEECAGVVSRKAFESAFSQYLEWHTFSDEECHLARIYRDSCPDNPVCP